MDLRSGFYNLKIAEKDRQKTAFSTGKAQFQFKRLPMGLRGSPVTFQLAMFKVFNHKIGIDCLAYIDDLICWNKDFSSHLNNLQEIFNIFGDNKLMLHPHKCNFAANRLPYLGHILSTEGVSPDPAKIEVMKNIPVPKSVKETRSLLGLFSFYRRYIKDYAHISQPLNELLKTENVPNFDKN
jgi:hypothetical protein